MGILLENAVKRLVFGADRLFRRPIRSNRLDFAGLDETKSTLCTAAKPPVKGRVPAERAPRPAQGTTVP
jgi:hypothetical protein